MARHFYGLSFHFQLLSTPHCQDAVTFHYWRLAPPERDFHPPVHARFQAHYFAPLELFDLDAGIRLNHGKAGL
jgi:hypothetical protein